MMPAILDTAQSRVNSSLSGRRAVVTGGSSGIGAACVRLLAAEGATVIIGYNHGADRAEAIRDSLPGTGHLCALLPLAGDQASAALTALAASLVEDGKGLDILVNSAGFTRRIAHVDVDSLDPDFFNQMLVANVGGTYAITRSLLPLLRSSGEAVVVNVSSVSGFTGSGSNIAYCASKAAVDNMTMSLARAFGPQVRFLSVSPASVDTDFVAGRDREELLKKAARTPLGRLVTAEDVALSVLGCITHLKTSTGSRIVIDGGASL